MKTIFTLNNYKRIIPVLFLFISINVITSCNIVENVTVSENKKASLSRKEKNVKIYPDILKRVMHIKNTETTALDFFVFDLDGTLIRHFKMEEGDHKKIGGLEKGTYVYQVFTGDEMSESGKLNIK